MAEPLLLILGGTTLAMKLAATVHGSGARIIYSLAGRVVPKTLPDMDVRIGGFGGPKALSDYIRTENITAVIDATHA